MPFWQIKRVQLRFAVAMCKKVSEKGSDWSSNRLPESQLDFLK
jgi:hypothetical protein